MSNHLSDIRLTSIPHSNINWSKSENVNKTIELLFLNLVIYWQMIVFPQLYNNWIFWATHVERKWGLFPFNMPWRYQIVLLSDFTLMETIWPKLCTKSLLKNGKTSLPVGLRAQKHLSLLSRNGALACWCRQCCYFTINARLYATFFTFPLFSSKCSSVWGLPGGENCGVMLTRITNS